jgi:hypothetical protein
MSITDWANAIARIESAGSGDYSAVGPVTNKGNRAYGRYQVMDFNVGPWTEQYYGRRLTPEEFLASPQAQDAVFSGAFGSSVEKYGNPQDAASVWFTGKPMSEGANRSDILGTTGSAYVDKFNKALGIVNFPATASATGNVGASTYDVPFRPATMDDPFADMGLLSRFAASRGIAQDAEASPISNLWNIITQKEDPRLAALAKQRGGFFGLLGE